MSLEPKSTPCIPFKELELPDTLFVRDIENKVFQSIVLQCLLAIPGISLLEGNFINNIFSRGSLDGIKGIHTEQDGKHQTIIVRIELNVHYGVPIPEKAEEIQNLVASKITELTGLHVASVHVIVKNVILPTPQKHPPLANSPQEEPLCTLEEELPITPTLDEVEGSYSGSRKTPL